MGMYRLVRKTRSQLEKLKDRVNEERIRLTQRLELLPSRTSDYDKELLRGPLGEAETDVARKKMELQFYLSSWEPGDTGDDYEEDTDSELFVDELSTEEQEDRYEQLRGEKDEARRQHKEAVDLKREEDRIEAMEELQLFRAEALDRRYDARIEALFNDTQKKLAITKAEVLAVRHEIATRRASMKHTEIQRPEEPTLEMSVEEKRRVHYEQIQLEREEARKKYNEAFELRKENDRREAAKERLASRAKALACHRETRIEGVFPFLTRPVIKRPEEPTLNTTAEEPNCLKASRDSLASYYKNTAKDSPIKQSVISRPEELALKMMVEEPHCAKAKAVPLLVQQAPANEILGWKQLRQWKYREIVAAGSDCESSSEEVEEPRKSMPKDDVLLGKRSLAPVIPPGDIFTVDDREFLESYIDSPSQNMYEQDERVRICELYRRYGGDFITDMISYEHSVKRGGLVGQPPIHYKDLQGGKDVVTLPENRKRFMPLITRDWSKQEHDRWVRSEESRLFREKHFGKEIDENQMKKINNEERIRAIRAARLAQTQPDIENAQDRKALTDAEKKANYRAGKRGLTAGQWKKQKEEKRLQRPDRKVELQRQRREKKRDARNQQDPTTGQEEQ